MTTFKDEIIILKARQIGTLDNGYDPPKDFEYFVDFTASSQFRYWDSGLFRYIACCEVFDRWAVDAGIGYLDYKCNMYGETWFKNEEDAMQAYLQFS